MNPILFSSLTDEWRTPSSIYNKLREEFDFNFDPCPMLDRREIWHYWYDGLKIGWKERNFINPPYSDVKKWIQKGYEETLKGKLCVFLVASRTDTKWFHEIVLPHAKEIRFIKGRLHFNNSKNSAPFPSCVIVFDGRVKQQKL